MNDDVYKHIVKKGGYEEVQYDSFDSLIFIKDVLTVCDTKKSPQTIEAHKHEDVEFILVLEGELTFYMNNTSITIKKGQGIIINARRLHGVKADNTITTHNICILLNPAIICTTKHVEYNFVRPLIAPDMPDYFLLDDKVGWQSEVLKKLLEVSDIYRKDKSNSLAITTMFFDIWRIFYANVSTASCNTEIAACVDSETSYPLTTLKNMLKFIYENYTDNIRLDGIAAAGNVCKSTCCKIFEKNLHTSPINFLISYRLQMAANMMKNNNLSITDIAYKTGFSSSSYFSETFRLKYGCTPSEYRNKLYAKCDTITCES